MTSTGVAPESDPEWSELARGWSITAAGASHAGRRPVNEDRFLLAGSLFAVADGVGGEPRGDLAAQAAVDALDRAMDLDGLVDVTVARRALQDAIDEADAAVADLAERWPELHGSATTVSAAVVVVDDGGATAVLGNVGDSRIYLLRNDGALQLTIDHTLASALGNSRSGPRSRFASLVTRVLGGSSARPEPDLFTVSLCDGDRLVLCTDGITETLDAATIAGLVMGSTPNDASTALVRAAWDAGSRDNLTAVCVQVGHQE